MKTAIVLTALVLLVASVGLADDTQGRPILTNKVTVASDSHLADFLKMVELISGVNLKVDADVLEAERFEYDEPIATVFLQDVTLQHLISWLAHLADAHVSLDVEAIRISTPANVPTNSPMFESYKETSVARQRELARHLTNDVVSIAITNAYFHSAFYDLSQISWTDLIIDREARSSLLGTERISVTVTNRPVGEVLRSIADQLNLDMKIQGGVVLMTKKTMGIPNNHMNECLKTIAFVVAYTAAILFGHAGLCSSVVGIISGIVTAFFFIVIFVIAAPIARSSILNRWPRRMAKSVLVLQTLVLSWIIAAVIAAVAYQDEWEFSVFWLVPVPFLLSFLLFVRWIRRLGNKKGTEQINGQISSESARSNEVSS